MADIEWQLTSAIAGCFSEHQPARFHVTAVPYQSRIRQKEDLFRVVRPRRYVNQNTVRATPHRTKFGFDKSGGLLAHFPAVLRGAAVSLNNFGDVFKTTVRQTLIARFRNDLGWRGGRIYLLREFQNSLRNWRGGRSFFYRHRLGARTVFVLFFRSGHLGVFATLRTDRATSLRKVSCDAVRASLR